MGRFKAAPAGRVSSTIHRAFTTGSIERLGRRRANRDRDNSYRCAGLRVWGKEGSGNSGGSVGAPSSG